MILSVELKDGKKKISKLQLEVDSSNEYFSIIGELVKRFGNNCIADEIIKSINAIQGDNTIQGDNIKAGIIRTSVGPAHDLVHRETQSGVMHDLIVKEAGKKKWEPQVISEEVIVHFDENKECPPGTLKQKEVMLFVKCECGQIKAFKTTENAGKHFHCGCGKEYDIQDTIQIKANCPNCGSTIMFKTLRNMDISEGLICKTCSSPVDVFYNEKKEIWSN